MTAELSLDDAKKLADALHLLLERKHCHRIGISINSPVSVVSIIDLQGINAWPKTLRGDLAGVTH